MHVFDRLPGFYLPAFAVDLQWQGVHADLLNHRRIQEQPGAIVQRSAQIESIGQRRRVLDRPAELGWRSVRGLLRHDDRRRWLDTGR